MGNQASLTQEQINEMKVASDCKFLECYRWKQFSE